jgi:hypothetical protein
MSGHVRLFISQEHLERWIAEDRIALDGEIMTLRGDPIPLHLTPAALVVRVAGGDADPHGLCGRVKTNVEVAALQGELSMGSLIVGDTAYDVMPGFVGEPAGDAPFGRLRQALLALG